MCYKKVVDNRRFQVSCDISELVSHRQWGFEDSAKFPAIFLLKVKYDSVLACGAF